MNDKSAPALGEEETGAVATNTSSTATNGQQLSNDDDGVGTDSVNTSRNGVEQTTETIDVTEAANTQHEAAVETNRAEQASGAYSNADGHGAKHGRKRYLCQGSMPSFVTLLLRFQAFYATLSAVL
eukprot:gb/GECG01015033.1/.p1 GENE.gb/GECG01015033.1/~~gb/GECG01015033.1/.p1  ORF type:complete len:126 (+),score=20.96 gb/GECG01015033.1/:1-378(+)